MTLKQFLKPDWRKIVIFVVVSIVFSLYKNIITVYNYERGFPLPFQFCVYDMFPSLAPPWCGVVGHYLIVDIIIWYILSCLIVWIYDKRKKKKR